MVNFLLAKQALIYEKYNVINHSSTLFLVFCNNGKYQKNRKIILYKCISHHSNLTGSRHGKAASCWDEIPQKHELMIRRKNKWWHGNGEDLRSLQETLFKSRLEYGWFWYVISKAVSLYAMVALGGRGIEPTHSWPWNWTGVSGQSCPSRALPPGKRPRYPLDRRLGWPQNRSGHRG
jgi:hypothetical protein